MVLARFLPRDEQFFTHFRDAAENAAETARILTNGGLRGVVFVLAGDNRAHFDYARKIAEQAEAQSRAVNSASRATLLSDARYRNGYVSQLDLLDARRSELRNRRQALQVRSAQYQATVTLVRALGGY